MSRPSGCPRACYTPGSHFSRAPSSLPRTPLPAPTPAPVGAQHVHRPCPGRPLCPHRGGSRARERGSLSTSLVHRPHRGEAARPGLHLSQRRGRGGWPAPSPAEGRTGAQGGAEWGSLRWAVLGSALPVPPTGPAREGRRPRTAGLPRAQGKSWGPRHIRQSTGVAPRGPAQGEGGAFPVRGQRPATHPGSPSDGLSGQHGGRRCVPSGCRGPRQHLRSLSGLRAPGLPRWPTPWAPSAGRFLLRLVDVAAYLRSQS